MKWIIEFYRNKYYSLLQNKVRAGSSEVIKRSVEGLLNREALHECMTSREDESRCQLDEHVSPSRDRGGKGRRDGVMGDQREDRGGLKGGHWSKSSREKVSSLPIYPPPAD